MHVIAVVSQKGGSGKTTLTGHLSVQAELSGHGPVAVIDCDPQGSLAAWWNEREAQAPVFVQTSLPDLRGHLENLKLAGVKTVVIDTPPAITSAIHEVITIADHVVVPTKPSPHDLRAVGATVKLVEACAKPMVFVLNDASPRAKITFEAAIALSQHGTVAPVTVHHRTLFASSMIDGRTAQELEPNGQSATEILGLWEYLNARLNSQVVPTSIGLDAMNRHDGQAGAKQPFAIPAAHDPVQPQLRPQGVARAPEPEVELSPEDLAPQYAPNTPEPVTPSLARVALTPRAVEPAPVEPAAEEPAKAPVEDIWEGFAPSPEDRAQHEALNETHGGDAPRVFGRRQVRHAI